MFYEAVESGVNAVGTALINSAEAEPVKNYIWRLYDALNVTMTEPLPYGSFHLVSLAIILSLTVGLSILLKNASGKAVRATLTVFWLVMILTEVIEKFVIGTTVSGDILVFDYRWSMFPYQLCATGLWVLPFIILMPDCRLRDFIIVYMGLYSFFGGLLVCVVPTTVFSDVMIINVHTMAQHGSQVVVGVLLLVHNRRKLNILNFLGATAVFVTLVGIALGMNEVFYHVMEAFGLDFHFNMFYLSPYYNSDMPVLGAVFDLVPWGVYVILYIVGFALISFIIYFIAVLSIHLAEGARIRREDREAKKA